MEAPPNYIVVEQMNGMDDLKTWYEAKIVEITRAFEDEKLQLKIEYEQNLQKVDVREREAVKDFHIQLMKALQANQITIAEPSVWQKWFPWLSWWG